ncbi:MAG: PhoH family protein [Candidatus Cloacimonadales bacterium]
MEKIFVLDTNVLIYDPDALFQFEDNRVVIPMTVIEEIDQFKKGVDEKSRNARLIGRHLDKLRQLGSLKDGVLTEHGGIVQVSVINSDLNIDGVQLLDTNDNRIIGTAAYFKKKFPEINVILLSKDTNVRIKADCLGIKAENYEPDQVNRDEVYTGFTAMKTTKLQIEKAKEKGVYPNKLGDVTPNHFLKLVDNLENPKHKLILRYSLIDNKFHLLKHYTGQQIFGIVARNDEQWMAFDLLLDSSVRLVSLSGIAGTGKTLIAIATGLHQVVEADDYNRLVVSRPISPLGKDLGFLPGTKDDKFNPWMQPIYDNMEILIQGHNEYNLNDNGKIFGKKKPTVNDYLDFNFIELEPLTYIRGRSLPNQFMIIDEAQNLTPHEMKTIITRAGENTKIVLTGDPYQIDIPYLDSVSNGLSIAVEKMKREELVGHLTLLKGERSKLAEIAASYF